MKGILTTIAAIIVGLYLGVSIIAFCAGIADTTFPESMNCNKKTRLKTVFPTYKLGCYLSEEVK